MNEDEIRSGWSPIAELWGRDGWRFIENFFGDQGSPITEELIFQAYLRASPALAKEVDPDVQVWLQQGNDSGAGIRLVGKEVGLYWPRETDEGFDGFFERIADTGAQYTAFLRFNALQYIPESADTLKQFLSPLFTALGVPYSTWALDIHAGCYAKLPVKTVHQDGLHQLLWLVKGDRKSIWTWSAESWASSKEKYENRPFECPQGTETVLRTNDLLYFSPETFHTGVSPQPTVTLNVTFLRHWPWFDMALRAIAGELSGRVLARGQSLLEKSLGGPIENGPFSTSSAFSKTTSCMVEELSAMCSGGSVEKLLYKKLLAQASALGAVQNMRSLIPVTPQTRKVQKGLRMDTSLKGSKLHPILWQQSGDRLLVGVGGRTFSIQGHGLWLCLLEQLNAKNSFKVGDLIANARMKYRNQLSVASQVEIYEEGEEEEPDDQRLIGLLERLVNSGGLGIGQEPLSE